MLYEGLSQPAGSLIDFPGDTVRTWDLRDVRPPQPDYPTVRILRSLRSMLRHPACTPEYVLAHIEALLEQFDKDPQTAQSGVSPVCRGRGPVDSGFAPEVPPAVERS